MTWTPPYSLMGLIVAGDVNETTIWTDKRGQKIWSKKNYPDKAPSKAQTAQRLRWRAMCQAWRLLDDTDKALWEEMSKRAYVPATGFNLFAHESLVPNSELVQTLRQQTGIEPPRAAFIPQANLSHGQFF